MRRKTLRELKSRGTETALVSNRPVTIYRKRDGSFSFDHIFPEGRAEPYLTIPAGGAEYSIEQLRRYILDKYDGRICDALESIGGLKLVRSILGWGDNFAVLDASLYVAPDDYMRTAPKM